MNYRSLRPVVLRMIKTIPRKNNTIHLIYQPIFSEQDSIGVIEEYTIETFPTGNTF